MMAILIGLFKVRPKLDYQASAPPPSAGEAWAESAQSAPSDPQIPCCIWKPDWACPPHGEEEPRTGLCYFQNNWLQTGS